MRVGGRSRITPIGWRRSPGRPRTPGYDCPLDPATIGCALTSATDSWHGTSRWTHSRVPRGLGNRCWQISPAAY